jgi:hypothetical protein
VRGKDFTYTAVYPDGHSEIVLRVPKYDFNCQLIYRMQDPMWLPKGARLKCVAHFDNSPNNPANPDPRKEVVWGLPDLGRDDARMVRLHAGWPAARRARRNR